MQTKRETPGVATERMAPTAMFVTQLVNRLIEKSQSLESDLWRLQHLLQPHAQSAAMPATPLRAAATPFPPGTRSAPAREPNRPVECASFYPSAPPIRLPRKCFVSPPVRKNAQEDRFTW